MNNEQICDWPVALAEQELLLVEGGSTPGIYWPNTCTGTFLEQLYDSQQSEEKMIQDALKAMTGSGN